MRSSRSTRRFLRPSFCGFLAQRRDLRGDLHGGDDGVAVPGHADGRGLAEAGACAGDREWSWTWSFLSWVEMTLDRRDVGSAGEVSKAARAAWATSTSCATVPPETPRAPMTVPSRRLSGMPPPNGARPPLVSSRPGAGAPGLQYSQTASLLAWNSTAVRALRMAMSIEPSTAPSMRRKAFRWAPASRTATITGSPSSRALAAAPSMTACAWWEVTCMTFSCPRLVDGDRIAAPALLREFSVVKRRETS